MIKIHLNSCFSTDFLLFPSSKTQSWPVGLVVMMVVGIGYLAVRNQSRSLYTVITFPNSTRQVSLCLLLLLLLYFSTPLIPLSSSASPSPLLSFPSTFLDIWSSRDTQVTVFTAQPAKRCIHSFLHCFLPHSPASRIPSMPTPPSAWLLTTAYFTVAHIKQPDEGNTVRLFQRSMIPHKGTLCVCVCVFFSSNFGLKYWRWGKRTNRVYLFWTLGEEESKICLWTINSFIITYWIYCSGAGYYHATMAWC